MIPFILNLSFFFVKRVIMTAFLLSIIVLAEMGDKTQLLAMAFATR